MRSLRPDLLPQDMTHLARSKVLLLQLVRHPNFNHGTGFRLRLHTSKIVPCSEGQTIPGMIPAFALSVCWIGTQFEFCKIDRVRRDGV